MLGENRKGKTATVVRALGVAVVLMAASAVAQAEATKQLQADAIRTQQAEIRTAAEAKQGRYASMSSADRRKLFQHQDRVGQLLGDVTLTSELSEHRQVELFNNLEAISAIVNDEEDERMVCRRMKPAGTNRATTVCRSARQLREDKDIPEQMRRVSEF